MKDGIFGFMLGAGIGLGLLLCPQVRSLLDKMTSKIENKVEKIKKKADKIKQELEK